MSSKIPQPKVKATEVAKKAPAKAPAKAPSKAPAKAAAAKVKVENKAEATVVAAEIKAEAAEIKAVEAEIKTEAAEIKAAEIKAEAAEIKADAAATAVAPEEKEELYPYARIRHYLDVIGVNKLINEKTLQYKPLLQKFKRYNLELQKGKLDDKKEFIPLTPEEVEEHNKFIEENKDRVEAINAEKIKLKSQKLRFSDSSIKYSFKVIQKIITDLLNAAAVKAVSAEKSIVHPKFLFEDDLLITKFELYSLICQLPSCKKLMEEYETAKLTRAKEKQFKAGFDACIKAHNIKKESKKAAASSAPASAPASASVPTASSAYVAPAVSAVSAVAEKQKKEKEYRGFETFVGSVGQSLKEKTDKKLKFSKKIKTFISDLIVELLQKIGEVIEVVIGILKVKTINDNIMESILRTLMLAHTQLKYEYETKEIITKIDEKELQRKAKDDDKRKLNPERKEYKLKGQVKEGLKINVYEKKILEPVLTFC